MAVIQISKIQVRRGLKNQEVGIPQLASGEMAWAIDAQELYIGNGAVSEGAPYVGNTRVLTEHDTLLDLVGEYQYAKQSSTIQTGADVNTPITNSLQSVIDQNVYASSFGVVGDGITDDTIAIQRAIDQLFLNPSTVTLTSSRVELKFAPGEYNITSTIYIPSNTFITGHGIQKTIFNFSGTGSVFETINDTSTPSSRSTINSTTYNNQTKFVRLSNFTITNASNNSQCFKLNALRDSQLSNIELIGGWENVDGTQTNSKAIGMYVLSSVVTCQRNFFNNISMSNHCYGVYAKQDILNNTFNNCHFTSLRYGVNFGTGADTLTTGELYGPRKNNILNSYFDSVDRHGILVDVGSGNKSSGNTFINVGNDSGGDLNSIYSHIKFSVKGNSSVNDLFDRASTLASSNWASDYISEVEGIVNFTANDTKTVAMSQEISATELFRLPVTDVTGYTIQYLYKSTAFTQTRCGMLQALVDVTNNNVMLVNEYEYTGEPSDESNVVFTAAIVNNCVVIYYTNSNFSDTATLTYTYSAIS